MSLYMTQLSMPLAGLGPATVLDLVRTALDETDRALEVSQAPAPPGPPGRSAEHVHANVRFTAQSPEQAHHIASQLHERALSSVLAAAPTGQGWTSSFEHPELATEAH